MDETFRTLLFLFSIGSLFLILFYISLWLKRVEGKLEITIIRSSALRLESYLRMRHNAESMGNKELVELLDNLIEDELKLGIEDKNSSKAKQKFIEEYGNKESNK